MFLSFFKAEKEYQDQSKDILNSILNEDVLSDSDNCLSRELIRFCNEIKML